MKQIQCNELNIKTTAKQVWLYFIRGTTWPGYADTTIVLNTQKNPVLQFPLKSRYTKNTRQKNPGIENFKPKKSFDHRVSIPPGKLASSDVNKSQIVNMGIQSFRSTAVKNCHTKNKRRSVNFINWPGIPFCGNMCKG